MTLEFSCDRGSGYTKSLFEITTSTPSQMPWVHIQTIGSNKLNYDDIIHCWFCIKVHCSTLPFLFIKLSCSLHVHFYFRPLYISKRYTQYVLVSFIMGNVHCSDWLFGSMQYITLIGVQLRRCCWTLSHEMREENIHY